MIRSWYGSVIPALALLSALASTAAAQDVAAGKVLPAEQLQLKTKDGVQIMATYLPSTKGKDAVAVILLHMFKGNRRELEGLGMLLQQKGHAVIIPDLRGHGESTSVDGQARPLDAATMPASQFPLMVNDLEAVKKYLVEQNNLAKLNIEKLCVVGAEMSGPLAAIWTVMDWAWPVLPTLKQGQDVKALVLLSPTVTYKTLNAAQAFNNPKSPIRDKIALLLICGAEDVDSVREARRLNDQLSRIRPKPLKIEEATIFMDDTLKTKLVGTKLLEEPSLGTAALIEQFIDLRLVQQSYPWRDRKAP